VKRGALVAVIGASALLVAVPCIELFAIRAFESKLAAHGFKSIGPSLRHRRLVWTELGATGLTAERIEVSPDWRRAAVSGVRVDISAEPVREMILKRGGGGGGRSMQIDVADLTVALGETVLVSGWHGTLSPTLDLEGPEGWVRTAQGIDLHVQRSFDVGFAGGEIEIRMEAVSPGSGAEPSVPTAHVLVHAPWVRHELLGTAPLHVSDADLTVDASGRVEGRWGGGMVSADLSAILDPKNGARVDVKDLPFAEVVAWFQDRIPEARRAVATGSVGLAADASFEPFSWHATVSADGLHASGVINDPDALRSGRFQWNVERAAGGVATLSARSLEVPWTDLSRAGWLGPAVVAAEDARFYQHAGYDTEQVNDAIAAWADEGGTLRGGSTITQQLAKNLFTGDERTLVRKLRELLYALDLEGTLPKDRILERYLNVVELGPDMHGVASAAQVYFLKEPARLTPKEAAFVASLLPSPTKGYEAAARGSVMNARIDGILENMKNGGALSAEELSTARASPLRLVVAR
jgi:Transglycosylase